MIRLGLCCIFRDEPIKFRTTTAAAMKKLRRQERLAELSGICLSNAHALLEALKYCSGHGIGCFRINSQILPIKTHPEVGYDLGELPGGEQIVDQFRRCGEFARAHGLRTTFHPDQFMEEPRFSARVTPIGHRQQRLRPLPVKTPASATALATGGEQDAGCRRVNCCICRSCCGYSGPRHPVLVESFPAS